MSRRGFTAGLLAVMTAHTAAAQASGETPAPAAAAASSLNIMPFSAHFQADWKNINVGTSDIELKPDTEPGHYVYRWTITARGVFRVVYSDALTQTSWFNVDSDHVRPNRYRGEQGSSSVDLAFDWRNRRATGTSEKKPVDLRIMEGTQDVNSIQVEVMRDLENGNLPTTFQILDKDEVKEFIYAREGTAKIKTALGPLDTVIVSSQRAGSNRILRMWFAPSLGYVPVQAERTRDGKLEFAMRISSLKR